MLSKLLLAGCTLSVFALAGCGSSTSSGGGGTTAAPQVTLSATSLAFGSVTVGQVSAAQPVTVSNSGNAALSLTSVTLSDTSDYSMTSTCGATLAPSSSCSLSIDFKPQSTAALPATVTIVDNASGSPQAVALTGTGTAVPAPQATLSTGTLSFPATNAGTAASAQSVTLSNPGNASLTGIAISIGGERGPQRLQRQPRARRRWLRAAIAISPLSSIRRPAATLPRRSV